MLNIIESGTTALLSLAVDATAMRQQAIAQNVANVNTPGYQRISVNFEDRISSLMNSEGQVRTVGATELATFRPVVEIVAADGPGNQVSLDTELAAMSENTLRHQMLVKALSKHFALMSMAINEGKR